jgi:hypothetical protein
MEGELSHEELISTGWAVLTRYLIMGNEDCCEGLDLSRYRDSTDYYVRYESGVGSCSDNTAVIYQK